MKIIIGIIAFISVVLVTSCKTELDGWSANFFYTAGRLAGPAIGFSASGSTSLNAEESLSARATLDGTMNYIYKAIQDYKHPQDEGKIDLTNIYKLLHTAGNAYEKAEEKCSGIKEKEVISPFDMEYTEAKLYNCAGNEGTMSDDYAYGFAIKDAGDIKHALLTFRWSPETEGHGILQGSYNEKTGDIIVHLVNTIEYSTTEGFAVRTHLVGNKNTHSFTIISAVINRLGVLNNSIVGKGISKGSGNYFLFKSSLSVKYFCIPATAGVTELAAMNPEGEVWDPVVHANCVDYKDDVDGLTAFVESDVPITLTDFNNAPYTGNTILLKF